MDQRDFSLFVCRLLRQKRSRNLRVKLSRIEAKTKIEICYLCDSVFCMAVLGCVCACDSRCECLRFVIVKENCACKVFETKSMTSIRWCQNANMKCKYSVNLFCKRDSTLKPLTSFPQATKNSKCENANYSILSALNAIIRV